MTKLNISRLQGGGIVLGYCCPSRCRHCLYGCGPHRRDGEGDVGQILYRLTQRAPHARYHIGGGEPFLDLDRLEHAIRMMRYHRLTLEYVETNASWVRDQDQAEEVLAQLAEGGLSCVLVSLSPFHAEHVPLARTLALIAAAERALSGGAFVWIPDFLNDLRDHPPEERLDLDAYLAARGDEHARRLASRYGLVPAGRTGRYLHRHGQQRPWREIAAAPSSCATRLQDTTHFHVDLAGQYVPGLCAGLVLPLAQVPGAINLDTYPVLDALVRGGPGALVELAAREGFEPHATYSGPCDLCTHARVFLFSRDVRGGLGPAGFYDPRSVDYGS